MRAPAPSPAVAGSFAELLRTAGLLESEVFYVTRSGELIASFPREIDAVGYAQQLCADARTAEEREAITVDRWERVEGSVDADGKQVWSAAAVTRR